MTETVRIMSNFYVAGNTAGRGDEPRPFLLVKPKGGLPYVVVGWDDATDLYSGVEHHAHVYRLTPDLGTAVKMFEGGKGWLAQRGAPHYPGPAEVRLTPEQVAAIRQTIAERGLVE